jgi:uncharacterized protein YjcR
MAEYNYCAGLTRLGTPCRRPAGWATKHPGEGRCKLHAGKSTGPKDQRGNKNALTTGEYETLHYSALSSEEQVLYDSLDISPKKQAEDSIRLACIREHRILIRIKRVEESSQEDGVGISSETTHDGWNVKGKVDFTVTERTSTLDTVMRLEDALTRVQALKAKYIDQLRGILKENPSSSGGLEAIVEAIDRSAKAIAASKEAERELEAATGDVLDG